jgi:NADH:ubiquinone oxidoreductase subunit H
VSFEVIFFFFLFCYIGFYKGFIILRGFNLCLFLALPGLVLMVITELNRPPFDFREGERELVRGFNLEYGGYLFVLLFLREYGFLLFFSYLLSVLVFFGSILYYLLLMLGLLSIRRRFPRYRYDKLMGLF